MESDTFEQSELTKDFLGTAIHFLKEGESCELLRFEGQPVSLILPISVILRVAETGSDFKGDTVAGAGKPAVLETGLRLEVPLFINIGDAIKVDTRDGSYSARA